MQVVYKSDKYDVAIVNPGRKRLIVTFDHWQKDKDGLSEPSPLKIADEAGHSEMMIRAARNDWFLSDETEALMSAVAEAAAHYGDVINYGFSMGGFASLLFSKATGAREVHAVAPQYSIDRAICGFETRWQDEFHRFIRPGMNLAELGNTGIRGIVSYDPRHELDRLHAEKILETFPNLRGASFFFGGHPPTKTLREAGLIGQMGRDIVHSRATPETLRHLFRQARRQSMRYWLNLGNACLTRHPAVARHALNSALPFLGNKKRARFFKIASQLCGLGDYSHLAAMKRIVATTMDHPGWWYDAIEKAERGSAEGGN